MPRFPGFILKNSRKPAASPAKAGFDAKAFAKNGVTEDDVTQAKAAFDLFDSDQGGSVDINGSSFAMQSSRPL